MIESFASKTAEDIFHGINSKISRRLPLVLHAKAQRLLDQINSVTRIETLRVPSNNRLKKLSGELKGFWRIKIDKQWAIIFNWNNGIASNVNIVDYH